jgi:hypothetical protein
MKFIHLLTAILFVSPAFAHDDDITQDREPWVQVGDMFVPPDILVDEDHEEGILSRGFKKNSVRPWRNGIIRYVFASNVSQSRRNQFLQACFEMGEFADVECLPRRSQDRDYIVVQHTNQSNICGSSYLGRYGGAQALKIRCWRSRTLQHELMHAFGISHEHNRYDRDDYITIRWENIIPGLEHNWRKVRQSQTSHITGGYDFESIMQYDSFGGSKNGGIVLYRTSLGPHRGRIRQSNEMSYGDHLILYSIYGGERP